MLLPSKELLFEVIDDLSPRVVEVIDIYQDNLLSTYYDCGKGEPTCLGYEINIYELMHMMKEWAEKKGYILQSHIIGDSVCKISKITNYSPYIDTLEILNANTEPEAVTKACEWILEQQT